MFIFLTAGFDGLQQLFPLFFLSSHAATALWVFKKNERVAPLKKVLALTIGFGIIGLIFSLLVR